MDFESLMKEVLSSEAPDLHLQVGQKPIIRLKNGDLASLGDRPVIQREEVEKIIDAISGEYQKDRFENELEVDFSYHVKDFGRFRVNVYHEQFGPAIAFRMISEKIPTLKELGLNETVERLCHLPNGLVLVTGPTGSGKSTTLAAMIDYINENRRSHVITIEDPIEYVFKNKNCLVTQREVNIHTRSFTNAIKSALRQDPDVVMVGEMRDLETIAAAMTLAETGHLVFSTLHTADAASTINRVIDVFPAYQQQQIKAQLASTLKGVVAQVLVPKAEGDGRVAAREILIGNDAIKNCIQQGQMHQIHTMMQLNAAEGMVLMDQSLEKLVKEGKITTEDALSKAYDVEMLFAAINS